MVSLVGTDGKETIIYKFEFLATCLALDVWSPVPTFAHSAGYYITYGDNDRVCFALSRGTGFGIVAATIIHMKLD
jgi:hypothetical protein